MKTKAQHIITSLKRLPGKAQTFARRWENVCMSQLHEKTAGWSKRKKKKALILFILIFFGCYMSILIKTIAYENKNGIGLMDYQESVKTPYLKAKDSLSDKPP